VKRNPAPEELAMRILRFIVFISFSAVSVSSYCAEHIVEALTTGANGEIMVFEPGFLKVEVGDTVVFKPSDASHNAESVFTPSPEASFVTELGRESSIKMSHEGVYLYKCTPHFTLGMVGVIQVGSAGNKNEALVVWDSMAAMMAMNDGRMEKYLAQIK
jgi:pseudoazurin|tara:strand:- start:700 stop:1176 length:477 start_codon:yes stop_codon:yes gene_type:complete